MLLYVPTVVTGQFHVSAGLIPGEVAVLKVKKSFPCHFYPDSNLAIQYMSNRITE
jgi:hypothetical protein